MHPSFKIIFLGPLRAWALGRRTPDLCLGPALAVDDYDVTNND